MEDIDRPITLIISRYVYLFSRYIRGWSLHTYLKETISSFFILTEFEEFFVVG